MSYPPDVVNVVLRVIGLNTVNRVDLSDPDVYDAVNALTEVDSDLQEKGYWFNTEYEYVLNLDVNGFVLVPKNQLAITFLNNNLIVQDGRIYDVVNHTYIFTEDITVASIVLQRDYESTPTVYKHALKAKAKLDMYVEEEGQSSVVQHLTSNWNTKEFRLRQRDLKQKQVNTLNTQAAMRLTSGMSFNPLTSGFAGVTGGYQWRLNR